MKHIVGFITGWILGGNILQLVLNYSILPTGTIVQLVSSGVLVSVVFTTYMMEQYRR